VTRPPAAYKSKSLATWAAVLGGAIGLHRLYLRGFADLLGWLHIVPTTLGLYGVQRVQELGQDDTLAWWLIPLLGLMVAQGMLHAIVYGLTPDERWDARRNPGWPQRRTRWAPVLGVVAGLLLGSGALMATIVISAQKFFEWQIEEARKISQ
jgi:hypothetical protein